MTKEQADKYDLFRAQGWEFYQTDMDGTIYMQHIERTNDAHRVLAEVRLTTDGKVKES